MKVIWLILARSLSVFSDLTSVRDKKHLMISFSENYNHYRWLSEAEAKTPPQIFDKLSSSIAEIIPSTPLRERL